MRGSRFLILIWLSVCCSAFTEAQAQPDVEYYRRSTIEACPEENKRPILQFLDEARTLADRSVRLYAEGRIKDLYALMSTIFREDNTEASFRELIAALKLREGKVLERDYHDQSLMDMYGSPLEFDPQKDFSIVRYAVKTTASGDGIFLQVRTRREGIKPVVARIDISQRAGPNTSAERRDPQSPGAPICPVIRDSLK
ncbi:MAG: hypothetical protein MOB07_05675 [Acidobacteria bacterium]|nr:hypothetical protein [Acidobacteriota bacterium]